jgi:proline iminopeptidase
MPSYDLRSRLASVARPTLVTVGRADFVTLVSSAETIAALVPTSKLVVSEKVRAIRPSSRSSTCSSK